jgi:hypothetical protein
MDQHSWLSHVEAQAFLVESWFSLLLCVSNKTWRAEEQLNGLFLALGQYCLTAARHHVYTVSQRIKNVQLTETVGSRPNRWRTSTLAAFARRGSC